MTDVAPDVSVVIPAYRAAESLDKLLDSLTTVFAERGLSTEYIVIDDRSPDDTWNVLRSLAEQHTTLRAYRMQRNIGQMAATLCGVSYARGDLIVTMDDDLQHPPEEVPVLLDALERNPDWDVVIGAWDRDNDGWFRAFGSRIFARLQNAAIPGGSHLRHTGFRAMRRAVGEALVTHETRHPVLPSLILEVADSVHNVTVSHAQREFGRSNFRFSTAVKMTVDNFVQSSAAPLYWVTGFGFFTSAIAAIVGAVYLLRAVGGADTPPGWTSSFLAVVFFGGVILATIGMLGRYIAVIMTEVRRPPRWTVRDRIGEDVGE